MNKSYLELRLKTIDDYLKNWSWKQNIAPYSHFFSLVASILTVKQKIELNEIETEFVMKWGYRITTAERIVFNMVYFNKGLTLSTVKKTKIRKGTDTWTQRKRVYIDYYGMLADLDFIKEWCLVMCRRTAEQENVSFESGKRISLNEPDEWG